MSRMRCGRPPRNSYWKASTRTAASAATKSAASARKRSGENLESGKRGKGRASAPTSEGSITSGQLFDAETQRNGGHAEKRFILISCSPRDLRISASPRRRFYPMKYIHYTKYTEEDMGIGA